jgi:hypothetical protein
LGCRIDRKGKGIFGGGSGSTAISSFFRSFHWCRWAVVVVGF